MSEVENGVRKVGHREVRDRPRSHALELARLRVAAHHAHERRAVCGVPLERDRDVVDRAGRVGSHHVVDVAGGVGAFGGEAVVTLGCPACPREHDVVRSVDAVVEHAAPVPHRVLPRPELQRRSVGDRVRGEDDIARPVAAPRKRHHPVRERDGGVRVCAADGRRSCGRRRRPRVREAFRVRHALEAPAVEKLYRRILAPYPDDKPDVGLVADGLRSASHGAELLPRRLRAVRGRRQRVVVARRQAEQERAGCVGLGGDLRARHAVTRRHLRSRDGRHAVLRHDETAHDGRFGRDVHVGRPDVVHDGLDDRILRVGLLRVRRRVPVRRAPAVVVVDVWPPVRRVAEPVREDGVARNPHGARRAEGEGRQVRVQLLGERDVVAVRAHSGVPVAELPHELRADACGGRPAAAESVVHIHGDAAVAAEKPDGLALRLRERPGVRVGDHVLPVVGAAECGAAEIPDLAPRPASVPRHRVRDGHRLVHPDERAGMDVRAEGHLLRRVAERAHDLRHRRRHASAEVVGRRVVVVAASAVRVVLVPLRLAKRAIDRIGNRIDLRQRRLEKRPARRSRRAQASPRRGVGG